MDLDLFDFLVIESPCSPVCANIFIRSKGAVTVLAIIPAMPPQIIRRVVCNVVCGGGDWWFVWLLVVMVVLIDLAFDMSGFEFCNDF